jgi:hypothetical protein
VGGPVDNSVDNFMEGFTLSTKKVPKVCRKNFCDTPINVP